MGYVLVMLVLAAVGVLALAAALAVAPHDDELREQAAARELGERGFARGRKAPGWLARRSG